MMPAGDFSVMQNLIDNKDPCMFLQSKKIVFSLYNSMHDGN